MAGIRGGRAEIIGGRAGRGGRGGRGRGGRGGRGGRNNAPPPQRLPDNAFMQNGRDIRDDPLPPIPPVVIRFPPPMNNKRIAPRGAAGSPKPKKKGKKN